MALLPASFQTRHNLVEGDLAPHRLAALLQPQAGMRCAWIYLHESDAPARAGRRIQA